MTVHPVDLPPAYTPSVPPPGGSRSRKAWLYVLWALTALTTITAGCVVRFAVFGKDIRFAAAIGDVRAVGLPGGAGLFCQEAIFVSNHEFQIRAFPRMPRVQPLVTRSSEKRLKESIPPGTGYVYQGFHLLEGSKVKVAPCYYPEPDFGQYEQYVIQGKGNLDQVVEHGDLTGHYLHSDDIPSCFDTQGKLFSYTIKASDDYYFLYRHHQGKRSGVVEVDFELGRTDFNYSEQADSRACPPLLSPLLPCKVPLDFTPTYSLVYIAPYYRDYHNSVKATCQPRIVAYVIFFCFVPLVLGIAISIVIYLYCACKENDSMVVGMDSEQSPRSIEGQVQGSSSPPPYAGAQPKYEDLTVTHARI